MSRDSTVRDPLHVDVSCVGNARIRDKLRGTFQQLGYPYSEFKGFWPLFSRGEAQRIPPNALVCGDLSGIIRAYTSTQKHQWIAGIRETRVYIVAFVRTRADEACAAWIEDLMRTSDLRVSVYRVRSAARSGLADCINQAVSSLEPAAVLDVRHVRTDESLWIEFGDGLCGSVRPAAFGFDDVGELVLETATVGPYHGGVQVLNRKGELIDIDGGSLRALLDDRFAGRIVAEVDAASRRVGERLKRHRVRLRVTQVQLAERSGLDQAIISKLERGRHQPRWDTLERYARGLGITTENLLSSQA